MRADVRSGAMSAYPLIATDERTLLDVSNVPEADIKLTTDPITLSVRASICAGTLDTERFGGLQINGPESYFVGCTTGRLPGFSPLRIRPI